jgi:hypothetical protein
MSEDEDDVGGGTLVMNPEERPAMPRVPSIADADATRQHQLPDDIDDEGPGMGTLIMAPQGPPPSIPRPALSGSASPFAMTMPARASSPSTPGVAAGMNLLAPSQPAGETTGLLPLTMPATSAQQASHPAIDTVSPFNETVSASNLAFGPPPAPTAPISQPGAFQPQDPYGIAQRLAAGGMIDPPTDVAARPKTSTSRLLGVGIGAGLFVVFFVVAVVMLVKKVGSSSDIASASATASPTGAAPPAVAPTTTATGTTTVDASKPTGDAKEAAARAGLEKLGEGIKKCVAKTIHVLPGTSKAVPSAFGFLKKGAYDPLINDWSSPFYACTGFKVDGPMTYAIQWQLDPTNDFGTGIAWLDDDGDGKPDRAFAFKATLVKRDVIDVGPIEPTDASRAMQKR